MPSSKVFLRPQNWSRRKPYYSSTIPAVRDLVGPKRSRKMPPQILKKKFSDALLQVHREKIWTYDARPTRIATLAISVWHIFNSWRTFLKSRKSMPNMTGRPGYRTMEIEWRKFRAVPRSYPLRSLFCTLFTKGGNRRVFRLPGAGGDHFHCTVEPSPGHIRCRANPSHLRPVILKPVGWIFEISDLTPKRRKCGKCGRCLSPQKDKGLRRFQNAENVENADTKTWKIRKVRLTGFNVTGFRWPPENVRINVSPFLGTTNPPDIQDLDATARPDIDD